MTSFQARVSAVLLITSIVAVPLLAQPAKVRRQEQAALQPQPTHVADLLRSALLRLQAKLLAVNPNGTGTDNGSTVETDSGSKLDPSGRT